MENVNRGVKKLKIDVERPSDNESSGDLANSQINAEEANINYYFCSTLVAADPPLGSHSYLSPGI